MSCSSYAGILAGIHVAAENGDERAIQWLRERESAQKERRRQDNDRRIMELSSRWKWQQTVGEVRRDFAIVKREDPYNTDYLRQLQIEELVILCMLAIERLEALGDRATAEIIKACLENEPKEAE